MKKFNIIKIVSFVFSTSILLGCNGHSNTEPAEPLPPTSTQAKTGEAVDFILLAPNQTISKIQWQQLSGPSVNPLSTKSKVIAFTAEVDGEYSFEVSYLSGTTNLSQQHHLTVNSENSLVNLRLGHAVVEGNTVSLRAEVDQSLNASTISWQQTSGPAVSFTEPDSTGLLAVVFNAPTVSQDTVLTFEVSVTDNGNIYQDSVQVLVENIDNISNEAYFDEPIAKVMPYKSNSPYADTLVDCVYSNKLTSSCKLSDLPLIGQDTNSPSVDDIMNRVVVSHQWMGQRFQEFLENSDNNNDFKHLLRATTAIVISYDIRPSFYWTATGAIYLDADNFWLTPDERDTINEAPDYRSDFGKDLQFYMPWRFVKDNNYAYQFFAPDVRLTRTADDGLYRLISLLYHELAHANDYFPSTEWLTHSLSTRVYDAAISTNPESDELANLYPLISNEMKGLAQVSFHGNTANATQKSYQPIDIEGFFSNDNATDDYNYSSKREDFAMLFSELMMQSRYNVLRDIAVTNKPTGDNISATDYIVQWGHRGRIGVDTIKPRAKFVVSRVLPDFDGESAVDALITPIEMISGDNWLENLTIGPAANNISSNKQIIQNKYYLLGKPFHHQNLPVH